MMAEAMSTWCPTSGSKLSEVSSSDVSKCVEGGQWEDKVTSWLNVALHLILEKFVCSFIPFAQPNVKDTEVCLSMAYLSAFSTVPIQGQKETGEPWEGGTKPALSSSSWLFQLWGIPIK